MAGSDAFDFVCDQLEQGSSLDRLEARGTVRIALKNAGLEPRSVSPGEMRVVLEKVLPTELSTRGIQEGVSLCREIAHGLSSVAPAAAAETPDAVFRRLGGGA